MQIIEKIETLLAGLGVTFTLFMAFYMWIDKEILPNKKPFNCSFCISAWIGIGLSIWYLDIFYLSLPIIYKLISKKL